MNDVRTFTCIQCTELLRDGGHTHVSFRKTLRTRGTLVSALHLLMMQAFFWPIGLLDFVAFAIICDRWMNKFIFRSSTHLSLFTSFSQFHEYTLFRPRRCHTDILTAISCFASLNDIIYCGLTLSEAMQCTLVNPWHHTLLKDSHVSIHMCESLIRASYRCVVLNGRPHFICWIKLAAVNWISLLTLFIFLTFCI